MHVVWLTVPGVTTAGIRPVNMRDPNDPRPADERTGIELYNCRKGVQLHPGIAYNRQASNAAFAPASKATHDKLLKLANGAIRHFDTAWKKPTARRAGKCAVGDEWDIQI